MIEIQGLHKAFDGKTVLSDINVSFKEASTNLVIGRSGAGKSVLLKCLIGLERPSAGRILFEGKDLSSLSSSELANLRQNLGMLFQGSALFDRMTVLENVMFPMEMFSTKTSSEVRHDAFELLERVGLSDAPGQYPCDISGGMMKRAAIARAIALKPKYLFCDEPNSGLDPKNSKRIDSLLKEITTEYKITTIINTHDMNTVKSIGDQIIYINKGKIEWQGSSATLETNASEGLRHFINANIY